MIAVSQRDLPAAFAQEVYAAGDDGRLDRAALLIAAGEYPALTIAAYSARLDAMAAAVAAQLPSVPTARQTAAALRRYLFDQQGVTGNRDNYYDPRNSYLNDVLDRRTGIPITLAALFMELARRLALPVSGVGYPGHFLVKYLDADGGERIIDPFHGGQEQDGARLRAVLAAQGGTETAVDYHLAAVTRRQMLTRMLLNLKHIYLQNDDLPRTLRIQEYLLALSPWSFPDLRDRGVLRARGGDLAGAISDLSAYVEHAASADDRDQVEAFLRSLRQRQG